MQRSHATTFVDRVRASILQHRMLSEQEGVLVALSGGPDSVALLAALVSLAHEWQIEVCAAHLNHGLRGAESLRDEQSAVAVAASLGVSCSVRRISLSADESNLEERAREARYSFLKEVATARRCTKIATGHTLDDQAETVLMRVMRGAGLDGLAGIRPVRDGQIIRPLIDCRRSDVLEFLRARAQGYCEDSSNHDRRFLRNRVRQEVLPLLEAMNPGVRERLAATAAYAAGEASYLDAQLAPALAQAVDRDGALSLVQLSIVAPGLRGRFIRLWLRQQRGHLRQLSAAHVEAILRIAAGGRPNACVQLPDGEVVLREYQSLCLLRATTSAALETQYLDVGESLLLATGWKIRSRVGGADDVVRDPTLLHFIGDAGELALPLTVRGVRAGDRVRPFGMTGHKKLQDLFVDRKVPLRLRRSTPVVEAAGEIIWVPGVMRGHRAPVTADTRRTLCLVAAHG